MITIQEMKAEVDRHLEWMVKPGGPSPQKSFDLVDFEWAEATFLVGGDEVSVGAQVDEEGNGSIEIAVHAPEFKPVLCRFLAFGEDLNLKDQEYIENLLDAMGKRVKFPVDESWTRWSE